MWHTRLWFFWRWQLLICKVLFCPPRLVHVDNLFVLFVGSLFVPRSSPVRPFPTVRCSGWLWIRTPLITFRSVGLIWSLSCAPTTPCCTIGWPSVGTVHRNCRKTSNVKSCKCCWKKRGNFIICEWGVGGGGCGWGMVVVVVVVVADTNVLCFVSHTTFFAQKHCAWSAKRQHWQFGKQRRTNTSLVQYFYIDIDYKWMQHN